MKTETLRKIAREYRAVADRKLDDKEVCKGFSDLCREEGIAWTQLRALVDAEAADARDGGQRVGKIVEKADFASEYAAILAGRKDERKTEIRSSEITPAPVLKPVQSAPAVPVQPSAAPAQSVPYEFPDLPVHLDRRVSQ